MKDLKRNILFILLSLFSSITLLSACSDNGNNTADSPELSFLDAEIGNNIDAVTVSAFGGEKMVRISSNVDWSVASEAGWLTLSNHSGVPTSTEVTTMYLKITAARNETGSSRSATITLNGASQSKTLTVIQPGTSDTDEHGFQLATTALAQMGNGVNIGNTLDANGDWVTSNDPKDYETCWGNPQITQQLIDTYKAAGIKAVRLPVTWRQHIDDNGNVDARWMARVKEVVDYIINDGMYCIVNVHHDCGGSDNSWLRAWQDETKLAEVENKFRGLWASIANEFKDYGDHLLFEGYNEMLDGNLSWTSTDADGYAALNHLAQTFVNTVRSTGGNNAYRNIIVCTYSSDAHETSLAAFMLPTDQVENHLIAEVHNYTPGEFVSPSKPEDAKAWNESYQAELDESFELINKYLVSKGIPTLIGEFGCNSNVPEAEQVKYTQHFVSKAEALGIPSFYWFDLINRNTYTWTLPNVLEALK